jgi:hypothetical protein
MKMEGDKIAFSKLWKYDASYKVGSIYFQEKKFGRVCMNQKWGECERSFKNWKTLSTSTPQKKGWSFLVNWIKGPLLKNNGEWSVDKS